MESKSLFLWRFLPQEIKMACVYLCVFEISLVGVASGQLQLSVPVCLEPGILVSVYLTASVRQPPLPSPRTEK